MNGGTVLLWSCWVLTVSAGVILIYAESSWNGDRIMLVMVDNCPEKVESIVRQVHRYNVKEVEGRALIFCAGKNAEETYNVLEYLEKDFNDIAVICRNRDVRLYDKEYLKNCIESRYKVLDFRESF